MQASKISQSNSSTIPIIAGATFTGDGEQCSDFSDIVISCKTDQDGVLYVDFSTDKSNWDSTLTYQVTASINEVHRLKVSKAFYRIRFNNSSASNQSFIRLQSLMQTENGVLSAPLNLAVSQDADATISKTITEETLISQGLFTGYSLVNKFGRNPDVDTGSVPEDVWNGGGTYTGFPTGSPEEFQVVSSSASDTGTLTFTYLASSTSTAYQTATVTLNGTTPVNTGITGYRCHTAQYSSGSSTNFNIGSITLRHAVTTANIFFVMPIGRSQTNVSGYTVPSGSSGYIRRLFCRVIGSTNGQVDGSIWVRSSGGSPRLRRPFSAATADSFEELPYGGIVVSAGSDIIIRISSASVNNLDVIAGYDLILVKA